MSKPRCRAILRRSFVRFTGIEAFYTVVIVELLRVIVELYLKEVVNVVEATFIKFDHLLCRNCNNHSFPPLKCGALFRHEKSGHIGMF